jgi:nucleotidyltransferase/DNA polymerase involved in DNA repair
MRRFAERFLHIDMDAFFVEVERKHDPSLVGVPVIVGGLGRRGVVASASYEARAMGVRSAMPIGEARRLCPRGRFVAPSHGRYGEVSARVFEVFRSFTPHVEGLSLDEAFLDISGLRLHYENPAGVGEALRTEMRSRLGLPSSVGISAVKFISKLASEEAKPDGLLVVPAGRELDFLHPLPVRRLWGVGQATRATLESLGIDTIGDLSEIPRQLLASRLGPSLATHLANLADGIDPRQVEATGPAKSISVEETYADDLVAPADIERSLLRLCDRLSSRMHHSGYAGHTVSLKLRFGDFETVTRSSTVAEPLAHTPGLWREARTLLGKVRLDQRGVRLLGVGMSSLVETSQPYQLALDSEPRDDAADAVEQVRDRFGHDAVLPASLMLQDGQDGRSN